MDFKLEHNDSLFRKILSSDVFLFLPGLVLAVLGTSLAVYQLLSQDVAYFLEIAHRILDGKKLYIEMIDNQFPAIHLISVLVVLFSNNLGIAVPNAFFLFAFLFFNGCIFLTWIILKKNPLFQSKTHQCFLLTLLYYLLFIAPHNFMEFSCQVFGQREHFFCALILPYLALVLNRLQPTEKKVSSVLTAVAGLLAGFGFCIKPHFILIFVASELVIVFYAKTALSWVRWESITILLVLLLCFLGLLFITPNYFRMLPYIAEYYKTYQPDEMWLYFLFLCATLSLIPLFLLLWYFIEKKHKINRHFSLYFFVLSLAALILIPLGMLGQQYHRLPFQLFVLLWAGLMILIHPKKTFFSAFLTLLLLFSTLRIEQQSPLTEARRNINAKLTAKIQQYAPNRGLVVFLDVTWWYPSITYANARKGFQFFDLSHIDFVYREYGEKKVSPLYHHPDQMGQGEYFFHEHVIHNLETDPPHLIILNKTMRFDFLQYFLQDPRFEKIWGNYRYVSQLSDPLFGYELVFYQRKRS